MTRYIQGVVTFVGFLFGCGFGVLPSVGVSSDRSRWSETILSSLSGTFTRCFKGVVLLEMGVGIHIASPLLFLVLGIYMGEPFTVSMSGPDEVRESAFPRV